MTTPLPPRCDLNLGDDHEMRFTFWSGEPPEARSGAIVSHRKPDGSWCEGAIAFDLPTSREKAPGHPLWRVARWEPLTLTPSVRCRCGDHGFIRAGRWVRA